MIEAIAIIGPTASGKSALALDLAGSLGAEIVSFDSRQAYRGIDIGTAKPTAAERTAVRHHLIDILDLPEKNDAERFARLASTVIADIRARGRTPILVGGTGLYLRAFEQGLFRIDLDRAARAEFERSVRGVQSRELHRRLESSDAVSAARIHPNDRYRIIRALEVAALTGTTLSEHFKRQRAGGNEAGGRRLRKIGLELPRPELHRRINERTERMIEAGWIDEVRRLIEGGADASWPGLKTLGYPEVIAFIRGEIDRGSLSMRIATLTRQYAKRQATWFRKETGVAWLRADGTDLRERALLLAREAPIGTS